MALLECSNCGGKVSDNTDFCSQCGTVIEKKSTSKGLRIVGAVILFPLVVLSIFSMKDGNLFQGPNQGEVTRSVREDRPARPAPRLGHKVRALAIAEMQKHEFVVDAAINQEGDELSFLLIVSQGTSISRAKTLGQDFVRILESKIKEQTETDETSLPEDYQYLIGVYTPDQHRIAVASKARNETKLQW